MSDIKKCSGKGCKIKKQCYRFTAKKSMVWQSYFSTPPIKDGKCDYFCGEGQEGILDQLKQITYGNETGRNNT